MNDLGYKRLAVIAVRAAAEIMAETDPDDRTAEEVELVDEIKAIIAAANAGDKDAQDLIFEAAPQWVEVNT